MRYAVEASFVRHFTAPRGLRRKPVLYALWQALFCLPMACLSYMGLLVATTGFAVMPSELVAAHAENPDVYLFVSVVSLIGIGGGAVYLIFDFYRRMRVLSTAYVDVAVPLLGLLMAFGFVLLTLLEGDALGAPGT